MGRRGKISFSLCVWLSMEKGGKGDTQVDLDAKENRTSFLLSQVLGEFYAFMLMTSLNIQLSIIVISDCVSLSTLRNLCIMDLEKKLEVSSPRGLSVTT